MLFRKSALALSAWLLSLCAPAFAQSTSPGQWVGGMYMVGARFDGPWGTTSWAFLDEGEKVQKAISNVTKAANFPELCQTCGGDAHYSYWHGDALYTLADGNLERDGEGMEFRRHVFAKWEDGEWLLLGTLRAPKQLMHFIPCDGGRFIVVSSDTDIFEDNRPDRSPFCVVAAKEGKKELTVVSSIDHGQDDLRKFMFQANCFSLAWFSDVIVTEGRATLVNKDTGLYWVFSTETARLVKAGSIFKGVTPEMIAGGYLKSRGGILCANPEKEGCVLLSAQDEGLYLAETENPIKEAMELWESVPWEQRTEERDAGIWETQVRRMNNVLARSPLIVWYRIHPENGRLERLDAPPKGGMSTRGDTFGNDFWRPMPDGSVKMGWDPHQMDSLKEQVPKWAGGLKGEGVAKEADGAKESGEATPLEGDVAGTGEGKGNALVG